MSTKAKFINLPKKNNRCKRYHETKSYYIYESRCNQFKKLEPAKTRFSSWKKDKSLVIVLRCRVCGAVNELRQINNFCYCEKCNSEIIYYSSTNYLYATPIYKNKNVLADKYKIIVQDYE